MSNYYYFEKGNHRLKHDLNKDIITTAVYVFHCNAKFEQHVLRMCGHTIIVPTPLSLIASKRRECSAIIIGTTHILLHCLSEF